MEAFVVNITILAIIIISSVFHEMMHAYMGWRLGDDTAVQAGRLSFNPLRHIDPILSIALPFLMVLLNGPIFGAAKPVPFNPSRVRGGEYGAALIAASGPLTNLALAVALGWPLRFLALSQTATAFLSLSVVINLGFFIFNLLPLPPLDGSRVLYAFAPEWLRMYMRQIEATGLIGVFLFVMLFSSLLSPYFGWLLSHLFTLITGHIL